MSSYKCFLIIGIELKVPSPIILNHSVIFCKQEIQSRVLPYLPHSIPTGHVLLPMTDNRFLKLTFLSLLFGPPDTDIWLSNPCEVRTVRARVKCQAITMDVMSCLLIFSGNVSLIVELRIQISTALSVRYIKISILSFTNSNRS